MMRGHPGLSLPAHVKEVDYFNRHYARGSQWYEAHFAPADGRLRGEVSPQYLYDPMCPARIAAANPEARLVVSVRQPVERVVSQFRHWAQETGFQGDCEAFLGEHPGAVDRSLYWELIERYRVHFPDEQIHVVVFEEMTTNPETTLKTLYAFLGVDSTHAHPNVSEAVNASVAPRFPHLYVQGKKVSRWLHDRGADRTVAMVKAAGGAALIRGRGDRATDGSRSGGTAGIGPEMETVLRERFRDDVASLSDYVHRDLRSFWRL